MSINPEDDTPLLERQKQVISNTYKYGFKVGYHGLSESNPSVQENLKKIKVYAVKFNIMDKVNQYYNKGKMEGRTKAKFDSLSPSVWHSSQL